MITVPQLKIDSSDTIIRYYIALASLSKQKTIAKLIKELFDTSVNLTYIEELDDTNPEESYKTAQKCEEDFHKEESAIHRQPLLLHFLTNAHL